MPATITVLLPSRGRPDSLRTSVASLRDTAAHPDAVTVLVAADPDDPATVEAGHALGLQGIVTDERYGYARLHEYYNRLANLAAPGWLLLWNDDAVMLTPGWDTLIRDLPDTVLVADLWAPPHSPDLCTFPAVRTRAVEALGGYSPHTPHVDTWWQDIGRRTGTIAPVPAHVRHDRADLTGQHNDATWREGRGGLRTSEYYGPTVQAHIAAATDAIRALAVPA